MEQGEKNLLGEATFVPIGGDRFRCEETGHELPGAEKEKYSSSKKCREALFDRALKEARSPLNFFEQSPDKRDRIICKLTGAVVNKNEKAVWKHVLGKGFSTKLSLKEKGEDEALQSPEPVLSSRKKSSGPVAGFDPAEAYAGGDMVDVMETIMFEEQDEDSMDDGDAPQKKKKKSKKKKKLAKANAEEAIADAETGPRETKKAKKRSTPAPTNELNEAELEPKPKKGKKKLKASEKPVNDPNDDEDDTGGEENKKVKKKKKSKKPAESNDEQLSGEDTEIRVKRTGLAIGPSSFASRKKKRKTEK